MTFGINSAWDLYSNLSWILVPIHMVRATYMSSYSPRGVTGDAFSKWVCKVWRMLRSLHVKYPFCTFCTTGVFIQFPILFIGRQQSFHLSFHSFLISYSVTCLAIVELASVLDMHIPFTISKTNNQSIKSKVHQFKTNINVSY